jgi:formate dehydrogenase maturation protein FdhE
MTRTAITEKERVETLREFVGKTVHEMQKEVDAIIEKVMRKEATELEEHRAAVLAKVIMDRTSGARKS